MDVGLIAVILVVLFSPALLLGEELNQDAANNPPHVSEDL